MAQALSDNMHDATTKQLQNFISSEFPISLKPLLQNEFTRVYHYIQNDEKIIHGNSSFIPNNYLSEKILRKRSIQNAALFFRKARSILEHKQSGKVFAQLSALQKQVASPDAKLYFPVVTTSTLLIPFEAFLELKCHETHLKTQAALILYHR